MYLKSWIQLLNNERAMNSIWCIEVQELDLFTIAAFLEAAEFGIERHEKNDPGVCHDSIVARGVMLGVPGRICACLDPEQIVQLLHERRVDVEWGLHAYLQSNSID